MFFLFSHAELAVQIHSEPLWWEKIGKVANWAKLASPSHSEALQWCIFVNFPCSDHSANHQKLNIIQKWAFHFLMTEGAFLCILVDFHHSNCSANHQKLNHNPKMSNSFFDDLGGAFLCTLVNFHFSDHLADHQKLNVIQK